MILVSQYRDVIMAFTQALFVNADVLDFVECSSIDSSRNGSFGPSKSAARETFAAAWRTRMPNASNISVKRECFPAQGTATVLTPH
jgi:uncharacterized protein YgbK (DUF1537 family)